MMNDQEFRKAALDAGGDPAEVERLIREHQQEEKDGLVLVEYEVILQTFGEA